MLLTKAHLLVKVWLLLLLGLRVKAWLRKSIEHVEVIGDRLLLRWLLEVIEHLVGLVGVAKVGHETASTIHWHQLLSWQLLLLLLLLHIQSTEERIAIHGLLLWDRLLNVRILAKASNIVIERLSCCHV